MPPQQLSSKPDRWGSRATGRDVTNLKERTTCFIHYQTGAARARPGWNDNSGIAEMLPGVWKVLYILRRESDRGGGGGYKAPKAESFCCGSDAT